MTYFNKFEHLIRSLLTTLVITHQDNYTQVISNMLKTMKDNIKMLAGMTAPGKLSEEAFKSSAPSLPIKEKHFIFVFLSSGVDRSPAPLNPLEAQSFNFGKNETLAVDKIVVSCFANSNRKNAAFSDMPFWTESDSSA